MIYFQNLTGTKFIQVSDQSVTIVSFGNVPTVQVYEDDAATVDFGNCRKASAEQFNTALESASTIISRTQRLIAA